MELKHSAYICTGCGIGEALDIEALCGVVTGEQKVPVKTGPILCSAEGRAMIEKDIAEQGINSVIIGACSPRVMMDEFSFGDDKIVSRANLREHVVWMAGPDPNKDRLQELASDYMRISCTRAKKCGIPDSQEQTINKNIHVIGGGVAGLTAAREAARTGYQVTVIEKSDKLGGFAAHWRKQLPTKAPWTNLEDPIIGDLIKAVQADGKIIVRTNTEVARIYGAPGMYDVTMKPAATKSDWDAPPKVSKDDEDLIAKGQMEDPRKAMKQYMEMNPDAEQFGAVVLASGWRPAEVGEYEHLGYGTLKNVLTNVEFEMMAAKGRITRPSDGHPVKSVAFVQSPGGAKDDNDFPYCNSVTSLVALKQAKYVREENPEAKAYVLYQHMRTPGHMELFYKAAQNDDGIFLTKANVLKVEEKGDGSLSVAAENTLLGENISLDVDLVVLAAGMVPTTKDSACVNLAYRQGPALIDLDLFDGYADSHFICFPYETRRTGVYACGGVRKAMTVEETIDDATGAALKAIQCIESANRGMAVHPRAGDRTFLEFFFQRCTQCKRCTEECPFGALDDDEKGTPKPNPTRCRRCGTCMGACPERIISFQDYNIDMLGSMVKCIEVPEDDEENLRIVAFVCENDAYPALDMAGIRRKEMNKLVRFIPIRCLGSVNMIWIKEAMSAGFDGVILLGCRYGDDYQCHFVKGSELADRRMVNIGETLTTLGVEAERVTVMQVSISDYDKVPGMIQEFAEKVLAMGPNPFKGF